MVYILKNNKIFYLSPVNQLLKEGLRLQEMFFVFHDKWPSYTKKAVNLLFESAVENLTCAILLGEEEAILPLSQLYYSGTIYDILPDLVFGDYIILIGQKLGYKSCQNISLRMITNTKCLEKQLDSIAITITSNMLFYHRHFKYIGDEIKKKIIKDCNEQFDKAWHFCKFEYSYSTLLSFEMPEEEAEKLEEVPLMGTKSTDDSKCLIS